MCTNVSLNTCSRTQKMCAWNVAHPRLLHRNNKGVKYPLPWNSAGHNCRNRLCLCASALSITSFRALQVCAYSVAQRGLSDRSNKGSKIHSALEKPCPQEQKQLAQLLCEYESNRVHVQAGKNVIIFIFFCDFMLIARSRNCHVMFSFTG